jgi:hypothetical protein
MILNATAQVRSYSLVLHRGGRSSVSKQSKWDFFMNHKMALLELDFPSEYFIFFS